MPKQPTRAEVNSFVKGLISEASPLNFPANCSLEEENFELLRTGSRRRRLGMDVEDGYTLIPPPASVTGLNTPNPSTFRWNEAGGLPGTSFLVVQIDNTLKFFDLKKEILSSDGSIGEIVLSELPLETKFSFAAINGKLVIASGIEKIAVVSYSVSGAFSTTYGTLKTRDVWGVEGTDAEGAKYEEDPKYRGGDSALHRYNLQNQSWGIPRKNLIGTLSDTLSMYSFEYGKYPSNSETVWPGLQFQPVTYGTPFERVYPSLYQDVLGADTKAAKGYFIIDVINRGSSRAQAILDNNARHGGVLTTYAAPTAPDYTDGGCSLVSEFAGRVFYGGFDGITVGGDKRSPVLNNYVFFSQLVKNTSDFYKCYQEGDPTSRDNSDIVDTDGGFIRIAGADRIIKLVNLASSLLVICSNGVWAISGGSDFGFTATNYKVDKLSTFGGFSPESVVADKGRVFFWSEEGIFVVGKDQVGALAVDSLTDKTIKSLYQDIPSLSRSKAIGQYDSVNGTIRWIYTDKNNNTIELVFDPILGAFYKYRIMNLSTTPVTVVGMFTVPSFTANDSVDTVYAFNDIVLSGSDTVISDVITDASSAQSIKYLCLVTVGTIQYFTFCYYKEVNHVDWKQLDGVGADAKSFLLTGHNVIGDSSLKKQIQYLTLHFQRTENGVDGSLDPINQSSCLVRSLWDWSTSSISNKWSALKQCYRYARKPTVVDVSSTYDTGFEILTTKNLLRGTGRSFSLYFESEPGKHLHILGWNITADGNQHA